MEDGSRGSRRAAPTFLHTSLAILYKIILVTTDKITSVTCCPALQVCKKQQSTISMLLPTVNGP
jgi:hypothetical protein